MNPLDRLGSLKLKLGLVIVLAICVTAGTMLVAAWLDVRLRYGALTALVLSLATVQLVARGTISPLRQMSRAADAIARGEHGQRVAVTTRDEVGQLGVAFNRMAAELEQTDRIRRDLVADAAHELRTPLSALRAVLENAVDGVEPVDPPALLAQVQRLGDLADQLLDLSQLEAGGTVLRRRPFAVDELLADARAIDGVVVDAPAGLRADGDPDRLRQVLANLLDNARRHAPGAPVTVRAAAGPDGGLRLDVEDSGPGLVGDDAERLFERFARGDRSRSTGGAGLGLAIARSIVELHGGAIHAEAAVPRGCRMVVELP
ncbi:sensor histidine kinase [Patulibacter defluvii]|uniref:sensor histidine kinase n=1 Tax=Patulibacter defluvii TaxID=3095358 RepID=UPI002A74BDE2|nr:ATP-binding protein [Patulibacter sp. DM4]